MTYNFVKLKLGIAVLLLSGLPGCSDLLDIQPEGRINLDEIFASHITTESYLNGCYQNFPDFGTSYYWHTSALSALSDDSWDNDYTLPNFVLAYDDKITPEKANNRLIYDNGAFRDGLSSWDLYYRNIGRCNVFLNRIGTAAVDNENARDMFTAEARILRAFYYMELIGRFGSAFIITEPLVEGAYPEIKKSNYKEVADFIIAECDDVIKNSTGLLWHHPNSANSRRMNKAVACAIKSRVALFMSSPLFCGGENHWQEAAKYTKESLDALLQNGYELYTSVANPSIFGTNAYREYMVSDRTYGDAGRDKETIFHTQNQGTPAWNIQGVPVNNHIKSGLCPTQELVDAFPMKDGSYVLDLFTPYNDERHLEPNYATDSGYDENNPYANREDRFYATILYNGAEVRNDGNIWTKVETFRGGNSEIRFMQRTHTLTGYYNCKYRHPNQYNGNNVSSAALRYFRLSEMYLNYSEAMVETNNIEEALAAVKPIRDRVNLPNLQSGTQEYVRAQIRHERRLEHALEELRYYDIRRWTSPNEDMAVGRWLTGMWIEKVGDQFEYRRFTIGDTYDAETGTWAGSGRERQNYKRKYLLHPLEDQEAARLKMTTGVEWQNPGW